MKEYLKKRGNSFVYAFRGIKLLFGNEANAKIHLCFGVLVIFAGIIFNLSASEWCAVIVCIGTVFFAEGMNTALEKVCDKVSPGYSELIGKAKDLAAGAVLLFVICAIMIGLIIFLPKILALF